MPPESSSTSCSFSSHLLFLRDIGIDHLENMFKVGGPGTTTKACDSLNLDRSQLRRKNIIRTHVQAPSICVWRAKIQHFTSRI
jgi:hypothetical protein